MDIKLCTHYPKEGIDKKRLFQIFKKFKENTIKSDDKIHEKMPKSFPQPEPKDLWVNLKSCKTLGGRNCKSQSMIKYVDENGDDYSVVVNPLKRMVW